MKIISFLRIKWKYKHMNVLFNFYKYRKFKKYNREKVNQFIDIIENEMNIIINRKECGTDVFFL